MVELTIDSIRVSLMTQQRVVILRDDDSGRYLPIWIGPYEAESITIELQGVEVARPLTHDLLKTVIDELGGKVQHVLVNDLRSETFYASIAVDVNGRRIDIDSRPSDAIALAVRAKVPIYAEESVMSNAAIVPEDDLGIDELEGAGADGKSAETDERLKQSPFGDLIDSLDLDDLPPDEN